VNPKAVERFITLDDKTFQNRDPDMIRKLCGLGLAFFQHRLAGSPFQWADVKSAVQTEEELRRVATAVTGGAATTSP
jgi:hypothetical protein